MRTKALKPNIVFLAVDKALHAAMVHVGTAEQGGHGGTLPSPLNIFKIIKS